MSISNSGRADRADRADRAGGDSGADGGGPDNGNGNGNGAAGTATAPAGQDPVADALLDAAFRCVASFGVRRLTLTDVARHAGVSRPTVYRRWPDITSLVADLLTREIRAVLLAVLHDADPGADGRTRLVHGATGVVTALREHPLLTRILDTEPETLVTYTFQRLGSSQHGALALLLPRIEAGQADGSIRPGPPAELARMVLLLVQTAVVSWRLVDDVLPLDRLTAELRHLLDSYLRAPEATAR